MENILEAVSAFSAEGGLTREKVYLGRLLALPVAYMERVARETESLVKAKAGMALSGPRRMSAYMPITPRLAMMRTLLQVALPEIFMAMSPSSARRRREFWRLQAAAT
jgi:hypothetical protein